MDEHIEVIKSEVKKQVKAEIERVRQLKPALAPGQTQLHDHSYLLKGMYAKPEYVDVAAEMKEWGLAIPAGENDRSHVTRNREPVPTVASEFGAWIEDGEDVTIDTRALIAELVAAGKLPDLSNVRLPVIPRDED